MHCVTLHLIITTFLTYAVQWADGCSRTPARHRPTPTSPPPVVWWPTSTPPTTKGTTSGRGQFDKPCDEYEVKEAACLHGGKCYVIEILDVRSPHCQCELGWTGVRCQALDSSFLVRRAGIATGAVAVVIIITIIIVYLIVRRRQIRQKKKTKRQETNGQASKSLIQEGTVVEYPSYDYAYNEKSETNV